MSLRRWEHGGAGVFYPTVMSYPDFLAKTAALNSSEFCTASEAYGVLSYLHSRVRPALTNAPKQIKRGF